MYHTHRKDGNHNAIKKAFELHGFTCAETHNVGAGVPDLIVAKDGITVLVEIKIGEKATFTPAQVEFWARWKGALLRVDGLEDVHNYCNGFVRALNGNR